jgi:hypothetical protein
MNESLSENEHAKNGETERSGWNVKNGTENEHLEIRKRKNDLGIVRLCYAKLMDWMEH